MKSVWISLLITIVLLLAIYYIYRGGKLEAYCNCSGLGFKWPDEPISVWRGGWPRSYWAPDLNFVKPNCMGSWAPEDYEAVFSSKSRLVPLSAVPLATVPPGAVGSCV